jgi:hypothetical protein
MPHNNINDIKDRLATATWELFLLSLYIERIVN